MIVQFLLVCDGSSDTALLPHIRSLLIKYGATEADGTSSYVGDTLAEKIRRGRDLYGDEDLLFIHRDAEHYQDSVAAGPQKRYDEIREGIHHSGYSGVYVPIVPVRMTEAWLLGDVAAIRRVAGKPKGQQPLGLPSVGRLEEIADAKELLRKALLMAGTPKGRRRSKQFNADFGNFRRQLLENLPAGVYLELGSVDISS